MENNINIENGPRILIVDDDPLSIFLSERLLKKHFNIQTVQSGYDAVSMAENTPFDVILMDINLGDINMDGIRTMKKIRQEGMNSATRIFALTAFSHDKKWYLDQGFDDLFIKPMTEEIIGAINNLLFNQGSLRKAV